MITPTKALPVLSAAERKRALIERGAHFRASAAVSKRVLRENLRGEALARSAVSHFTGNASAVIGGALKLAGNANSRLLLSVAMAGFSLLSRRGLLRPTLRGALALGAIGALVVWGRRKWRSPAARRASAAASSTQR